MTWELECPACGALVEAADEAGLVAPAQRHCIEAHGYHLPEAHVFAAAVRVDRPGDGGVT